MIYIYIYISHLGFPFTKYTLHPRCQQDMLWNEDPEGSPHESRHVVCATAQFQREKAAAKAAQAAQAAQAAEAMAGTDRNSHRKTIGKP